MTPTPTAAGPAGDAIPPPGGSARQAALGG
jgi:hypothetical protein